MTAFPTVAPLSRLGAILLVAFMLAGYAAAPDPKDADAVAGYEEINDPAEPTNRAFFEINLALDKVTLKPIAFAYKEYLPDFVQSSINSLLNNLLQGEFKRAGTTLLRFVINSTIGIGGLHDQAAEWDLEYHNEDFGQTLANWGMPEGPYVMLPILGPSNPRDAVGLVVDFLLDPLNLWLANTNRDEFIFARTSLRAVDQRARHYDALQDLEESSLDFYAAIRSLYRQRRADEINQGKGSANMPALGLSKNSISPTAWDGDEASRDE
ncbi:MAG TPA: VacJ family lipoprotein [Rhodospirillales bacterium]|nr:VacJ family lipoprotein [Rhodospirillales bacterium]